MREDGKGRRGRGETAGREWGGKSRKKGEAGEKQGEHTSVGRHGYRNSHLSVTVRSSLPAHLPALTLLPSHRSPLRGSLRPQESSPLVRVYCRHLSNSWLYKAPLQQRTGKGRFSTWLHPRRFLSSSFFFFLLCGPGLLVYHPRC